LAVIIADTDVLIDFLVGAQPVADQIAGYIETEQRQTTAVTAFELLSGADESKRGKAKRLGWVTA
jgi:predicted nucleic acid-binding protein